MSPCCTAFVVKLGGGTKKSKKGALLPLRRIDGTGVEMSIKKQLLTNGVERKPIEIIDAVWKEHIIALGSVHPVSPHFPPPPASQTLRLPWGESNIGASGHLASKQLLYLLCLCLQEWQRFLRDAIWALTLRASKKMRNVCVLPAQTVPMFPAVHHPVTLSIFPSYWCGADILASSFFPRSLYFLTAAYRPDRPANSEPL